MIYELEITLRTLRREGLGSLFNKIGIYVYQLACAARFFFLRLPRNATAEQLVDFSFNAAGGLLHTSQVRSEIIQLTDLIGQRRPKTVVEIGTAQGGTLILWCRQADPQAQNYFTARFWGSDVTQNRLVLFCEGRQIG